MTRYEEPIDSNVAASLQAEALRRLRLQEEPASSDASLSYDNNYATEGEGHHVPSDLPNRHDDSQSLPQSVENPQHGVPGTDTISEAFKDDDDSLPELIEQENTENDENLPELTEQGDTGIDENLPEWIKQETDEILKEWIKQENTGNDGNLPELIEQENTGNDENLPELIEQENNDESVDPSIPGPVLPPELEACTATTLDRYKKGFDRLISLRMMSEAESIHQLQRIEAAIRAKPAKSYDTAFSWLTTPSIPPEMTVAESIRQQKIDEAAIRARAAKIYGTASSVVSTPSISARGDGHMTNNMDDSTPTLKKSLGAASQQVRSISEVATHPTTIGMSAAIPNSTSKDSTRSSTVSKPCHRCGKTSCDLSRMSFEEEYRKAYRKSTKPGAGEEIIAALDKEADRLCPKIEGSDGAGTVVPQGSSAQRAPLKIPEEIRGQNHHPLDWVQFDASNETRHMRHHRDEIFEPSRQRLGVVADQPDARRAERRLEDSVRERQHQNRTGEVKNIRQATARPWASRQNPHAVSGHPASQHNHPVRRRGLTDGRGGRQPRPAYPNVTVRLPDSSAYQPKNNDNQQKNVNRVERTERMSNARYTGPARSFEPQRANARSDDELLWAPHWAQGHWASKDKLTERIRRGADWA